MARFLCTFSGVFGDILWSLPTARAIAESVGQPVDFKVMAHFGSLCPLIALQPYVASAEAVPDWTMVHGSWGAQPWQPPAHVEEGYDRAWHLGYRGEPQESLVKFIATQQGVALPDPLPPFIAAGNDPWTADPYVVSGIGNPQDYAFMQMIKAALPNVPIVISITLPWGDAARAIRHARAFIGSRSSNYVLAHGLGLGRRILTYEQDLPRRHPNFGNPYAEETMLPYAANGKDDVGMAAEQARIAIEAIRSRL